MATKASTRTIKAKNKPPKMMVVILSFTAAFYALTWLSEDFADFYTNNIFPYVTFPLLMISKSLPFSLGELMIIASLVLIAIDLLLFIILIVPPLRKGSKSIRSFFYSFTAWILVTVILIMNLNCFALYHAKPLSCPESYSVEELTALRNDIVEHCNKLSGEIARDEDGKPLFKGDMKAMAGEALVSLAEQNEIFTHISSWQTKPKGLFFSGFISQQNMQGYYFPFSMEANYNTVMNRLRLPFTMCHELGHTNGYILEDEANLIAFLACIGSDDEYFRYSGYLGVLNYVNNEYYYAVGDEEYALALPINPQVRKDNVFLTDNDWAKVEEGALLPTESVRKAADRFVDSTLKINGVKSGKISYNHVVALLLEHYPYSRNEG
ncbi:DUF3810 domain-containing protein [Butyrivibrio sp. MC2013]|uniref:DUF3810 domain-containing protein n=1 Tax=Butyrivibrio sp. MC2013 TaxID=1280686 RepID=UPI000414BA5F|nr:DUF3810 domain-containing protein [Butyrivibrio sp. MC2013]